MDMRQIALPVLEAGGVDLVLTGHSHSYERSFLLDGHYGLSGSFLPAMKLDPGSGRDLDTGPYLKPGGGPATRQGAVYAVAGSSGQTDSGPLNHPAMYLSLVSLGSMVLDVDGDRLDARFLDTAGAVQDQFAIEKVAPVPVCGNGAPEGAEECDDGNAVETDDCRNDCTAAVCGDGIVHAGVEQCDDGNADNGDECRTDCVLSSCGDGILNAATEECDDGNANETDACLASCRNAACGDGFVRAGIEECDDGNAVETDDCRTGCTIAACGDGIVHAGVEQCDDGNPDNTDGCLDACTTAVCGDGALRSGIEQCDDGNADAGDGCDPLCRVSCASAPRIDCRAAAVSTLRVASLSDPARNALKWQWTRGTAFARGDLGDPTVGGVYDLCLYVDVPGSGALTAEVELPAGPPWTAQGTRNWAYRDPTNAVGGLFDVKIMGGTQGRTRVKVRGRGTNLPAGLFPATSYTVQLLDLEKGECWSSAFASGSLTATTFQARTVLP